MDRLERIRAHDRDMATHRLWSDPSAWEFDAPDQIFITRAIHLLGSYLFQDRWPNDLAQLRHSAHFGEVSSIVREHCAFGRLVAYFQRSDGSFEQVLPHYWNTREFQKWIAVGKIPFEITGRLSGWHPLAAVPQDGWLFIGRDELTGILDPQHQPSDHGIAETSNDGEKPSIEDMTNFFVYEVKQLWIDKGRVRLYGVSQDDFTDLCTWRFGTSPDRETARRIVKENAPTDNKGWPGQGNREKLTVSDHIDLLKHYKEQSLAGIDSSAK